jgi:membrane protease YdiL (CAAX protease family)
MPLKEWLPSSDDMSAKPWGLWATLGFSAMIFAFFSALQILVATAFVSLAKAEHPELNLEVYAKSLSSNGFCIAIMTVVSGLICTPLTLLFTKLLLFHQRIVPPFMIEAYKTASSLPALLFAIVVVAPIFEEIFFRGFLFQGIRYSRLGPIGAIGITSLLWAVIHLQYDIYGMATVFALGLLFGMARLKTDSIHLLMVMHSFVGLVATMETALYVGTFNG